MSGCVARSFVAVCLSLIVLEHVRALSDPALSISRVSPVLPSSEVLAWSREEVSCFIHYNMATMVSSQGCQCDSPPPPLSAWQPIQLNTDQWIKTGVLMGCRHFVYVAKHNCGFLAWPSKVSQNFGYNYSVTHTSHAEIDVVASFVKSAQRAKVGYGFYYSVVINAYANVCNGVVQNYPQPGQISLTQQQYEDVVIAHLSELWGQFGDLSEVWFDGGYPSSLTPRLQQLFSKLQPHVVAFQGNGLTSNAVRWVGTESGFAPTDTWSTCDLSDSGAGDPNSPTWFPAETDFTLQNSDTWFYDANVGVHTLDELKSMYEASVGHNSNAIINLSPFPNGTISFDQVSVATALGDWVNYCYFGKGVLAAVNGTGYTITLTMAAPVTINRIVIQEDQTYGQLIRQYQLLSLSTTSHDDDDDNDNDSDSDNAPEEGEVDSRNAQILAEGKSVGNKRIHVFSAVKVSSVQLTITSAIDVPVIRNFALLYCD